MRTSEVEDHVESLNQLVERRSVAFWLGIGVLGVVASLGATVVAVGVADAIAVVAAIVMGSGATGAAVLRRRLSALPLELAPTLASTEGARGSELTARGWLGRGRAVDSVEFTVSIAGEPVEVLALAGPAVGRFQVVFPAAPGDVEVTLVVVEAGKTRSVCRTYAESERSVGRFHPGVRGRPLQFLPAEWGRVLSASDTVSPGIVVNDAR